jgi:hypothetical protein
MVAHTASTRAMRIQRQNVSNVKLSPRMPGMYSCGYCAAQNRKGTQNEVEEASAGGPQILDGTHEYLGQGTSLSTNIIYNSTYTIYV